MVEHYLDTVKLDGKYNMNYQKIYDNLVIRASVRTLNEYGEWHHIVPRCLGGKDDKINLVYLTPEEHYLAHQLLVKINPDNSALLHAAVMMVANRPSNKLYGWLRRKLSKAQSKKQTGSGNTQFGTKWIYNSELKVSKKISISKELPDGWILGRKINFEIKKCICCELPVKTRFASYCEVHSAEIKSINGRKNSKHFLNAGSASYKNRKFITDGVDDKLHLETDPLPHGWNFGRSNNKHRSLTQR